MLASMAVQREIPMCPIKVNTDAPLDLVWFDPGVTSGVCYISVSENWMRNGAATWTELGKNIFEKKWYQVGRHARNTEGTMTTHNKAYYQALPTYVNAELAQVIEMSLELRIHARAAWGYEDFIPSLSNQSREFLSPVRIFSHLISEEMLHGGRRPPFVQSRSFKNTANDARLKMAGLYRPGMPHATDAARHAAVFLRRCRIDTKLRAQAWPEVFGE